MSSGLFIQFSQWDVVPTGNGKCTIQNSGEKSAYLGWRADSKTGFAAVRKVAAPHTWELTSFGGGYTYSCVSPPRVSCAAALSAFAAASG